MKCYASSHLSDGALLRELNALVARDRAITAELLAHLAEVDARRLSLPAAYPSMFTWCVGELKFSEDAAYKRLQAARAARQFPAIFAARADGRLHLAGLCLLAPHLTPGTSDALLAAAAGKSKAEIERLLAVRFPRPDLPTVVRTPAPRNTGNELAPGQVGTRDRLAPLAPTRHALQATIGRETHDLLRQAQALLGQAVPAGDLDQVLNRALKLLVRRLERRRFAGTDRPRPGHRRCAPGSRDIPAAVRREVWQRDGGRCTFVSDSGHRCEARTRLEFDHVTPYARGGRASTAGVRPRCRAHIQHAAAEAFGAGFMERMRQAPRRRSAAARGNRTDEHRPPDRAMARVHETGAAEPASSFDPEVIPWLRALGFRAEEARRASVHCAGMFDAPLEGRVRGAISFLAPSAARRPLQPHVVAGGRDSR